MTKFIKEKMDQALFSTKEADYSDVRVVKIENTFLSYYNNTEQSLEQRTNFGLAVRVMVKGSWGFSCTSDFSKESIIRCSQESLQLARAGVNANQKPHKLTKKEIFQDRWSYPEMMPLTPTRLLEIKDLLLECNNKMQATSPTIKVANSLFRYKKTHWFYKDSEGSDLTQIWSRSGAGLAANSIYNNDNQRRSFHMNHNYAGGIESIHPHKLLEMAPILAHEAYELTKAPEINLKKTDLIIGVNQLALQIHESVGHPNELDRVLGWEANFAGTSFNLIPNKGKLKYGASLVNFVADQNLPGGTGTRAYDDDGVRAQRWYIVKEGIFQDYYTSRDTAHYLGEGETSRGCSRADSWSSVPIIRIPNVSLLPGENPLSLEELISSTEDGIFVDVNRSWSIDQRRDQFQFGVEKAYEIKNGQKGRLLKNLVYRGNTIPFWNSVDAICDASEFKVLGEIYCGKGQPMQTMEMAHGCSPTRFRQVEVCST